MPTRKTSSKKSESESSSKKSSSSKSTAKKSSTSRKSTVAKKSGGAKKTTARKRASKTSKRTLIEPHKGDRRYVRRNKKGQFKDEVNVGRSLAADRRRTAKKTVAKGQGDRGDTGKKGIIETIFGS